MFFVFIMFLLIIASAHASQQDGKAISEPVKKIEFYVIDPTTGRLKKVCVDPEKTKVFNAAYRNDPLYAKTEMSLAVFLSKCRQAASQQKRLVDYGWDGEDRVVLSRFSADPQIKQCQHSLFSSIFTGWDLQVLAATGFGKSCYCPEMILDGQPIIFEPLTLLKQVDAPTIMD